MLEKHRADYLYNIAALVPLPHLKARYRIDASHIFQNINQHRADIPPSCPRCLLQHDESMLQYHIQPEVHQNLLRRYEHKDKLTRFQTKHLEKIKKTGQKLMIKCSTCARTTKISIQKPGGLEKFRKKKPVVIENETKTKKKKKKKNKFAGIDEAAVEQAQSLKLKETKLDDVIVIEDSTRIVYREKTPITKDFVSLEPSRKRVLGDVIVIDDSPLREKRKAKAPDTVPKSKKQKKLDLQALKQQMKDVEETRQNLDVLATKHQKKKLKHKSKKLKDAISNIEHNSKPRNPLQDFLSTLSV